MIGLRSASWEATIKVQRNRLFDHLDDNPSLEAVLMQTTRRAYENAVIEAEAQTGLAASSFPAEVPWSWSERVDQGFWPG